jgi:hypothetical protein
MQAYLPLEHSSTGGLILRLASAAVQHYLAGGVLFERGSEVPRDLSRQVWASGTVCIGVPLKILFQRSRAAL